MAYVDLSTLPIEHYLRNVPLGDIDAETALRSVGRWRPVKTWRLASASYNELGAVWTRSSEWRVQT